MFNFNLYTVGWICAVGKELVAAKSFLDDEHDPPDHVPDHDNNTYVLGRIAKHNIVIATMPIDQYGLVSATTVARDMVRSFPGVRIGLMVGIGGGAPSSKHDIRLGDIVVSSPSSKTGGVLQYDYGKTTQQKKFLEKGHLNQPPQFMLTALAVLEAEYESEGHSIEETIGAILEKKPRLQRNYRRPDISSDRLYRSSFTHQGDEQANCNETCGNSDINIVHREDPEEGRDSPTVHRGLIASANQLMKDAMIRDTLSKEKDVLCFEMEAAGLMNHFPCTVIRGICDYSDTHKNDLWQGYAAMAAAAYAKDLLLKIAPKKIEAERTVKHILDESLCEVCNKLESVESRVEDVHSAVRIVHANSYFNHLEAWLSAPDPSTNLNRALENHHPGTGSWLLSSVKYSEWIRRDNSILWLNGIPGCGKTVMSAAIIEDLERLTGCNSNVIYFYFDFSDSGKQTLEYMLRSLIIQLYRKKEIVRSGLDSLHATYKKLGRLPNVELLRTTFRDMIRSSGELFIVLDALDECETQGYPKGGLLGWISSIVEIQSNIHLLVTSRMEHDVKSVIKKWSYPKAVVTLQKYLVHNDISRYIKARLQQAEFFDWPKDIQEQTNKILVERASGMFRWAVCQLEVLKHCHHQNAIRETLSSLPKTLDETYARILERVPEKQRPYTTRILQFLAYSLIPLTVDELGDAVVVETESRDPLDPRCRLWNPMEITKYCSDLVITSLGGMPNNYGYHHRWLNQRARRYMTIQLAHSSVKEYLVSNKLPRYLAQDYSELNARASIATVCLAYLLQLSRGSWLLMNLWQLSDAYPLAKYAVKQWISHAAAVESNSAKITDLIVEFISCRNAWRFSSIEHENQQVLFAATHGLFHTTQHLIHDGKDINAMTYRDIISRSDNCALWGAINGGHYQIVKLLLDSGAIVATKDANPLAAAAARGFNDMIQIMLDKGTDINGHDINQCTALRAAAVCGKKDTVKLLLRHGANVHFECEKHSTALRAASLRGDWDIVRLLFNRDGNMDWKDERGRTALHDLVWSHSLEKARMVIDLGANVDAEDWQGQSPLRVVASRVASRVVYGRLNTLKEQEHDDVAKLLIDRGANVNGEDHSGRTIMHMAAIHNHRNLIKLLIDHGINVDTENRQGKTPLQVAVERDHELGVGRLVEFGADINRLDKHGKTPLQLAIKKRYVGVAAILRESEGKVKDR